VTAVSMRARTLDAFPNATLSMESLGIL